MDQESPGAKLLASAFFLYMITVTVACAYYNWRYANENGFVKWLLLGEIVPTAKALVWPYFVFGSSDGSQTTSRAVRPTPAADATLDPDKFMRRQQARAELKKFLAAIESSQNATLLLNARPDIALSDMPNLPKIIAHRRKALEIADTVDTAVLDRIYPELGTRFKDQFRDAVELFIEGCEKGSNASLSSSKLLNDKWADWYMANRQAIEDAANDATR
jgi:hypothetical protein